MDGNDDGTLWNGSEGDGNVSMRKMKVLTVKMETVTLISRQNLTSFVHGVYEISSNIYVLSRRIFWGLS
jgi:hypothetical protein